jgi:hypothetical protein
MKPALLGAAVLMGLLLVYWAALYLGQRALLFPAPSLAGALPRPNDAKVVWLEIAGGRVEAWYLPPLIATRAPSYSWQRRADRLLAE